MKTATIFISILLFFQIPVSSSGQSYSEPKPIMTRKLLKDFIHIHIAYPEISRVNKTEGNVEIKFRIDEKGIISERWITKKVSPEIDIAALHLFDLILWNPASEYGIPVESTGEFLIQYNLKKYAKYVKARGYDVTDLGNARVDTSYIIYQINQLQERPKPLLSNEYKTLEALVYNEMSYPEEARKLGIKGDVKLSFIIEVNGLPSNIFVEKTVGGGCCEESIRILELLKWNPGIKDDLYVRTKYELTIHFSPPEERNMHIPNQSNSGL